MMPIVSVSPALLFLIKLRCGASVNTINIKCKNEITNTDLEFNITAYINNIENGTRKLYFNFKEQFRKIEKLSRKCVNLQGAIIYIYNNYIYIYVHIYSYAICIHKCTYIYSLYIRVVNMQVFCFLFSANFDE